MENVSSIAPAAAPDHCHLRIPGLPAWIQSTVEYLVRRATQSGAVARTRSYRLTMALQEALSNAVLHGNLGLSSSLKEQGDDAFARAVTERCADPAYARRVVDVQASFD